MTLVGFAGVSFLRGRIFGQCDQVVGLDELGYFVVSCCRELGVPFATFDLDNSVSLAASHSFLLVEVVRR
jgi:hypothetical protein